MGQVLTNALISAAGYSLIGVGFSLIWTSARFFHIAHGIVLTIGAYATFALRVWGGVPLPVSIFGGIATSTLLGIMMEWGVYRCLRRKGSSPGVLLIASLGIYIALQAILVMIFGSGTRTFRLGGVPEGLLLGGIRITLPQITTIAVAGGCLFFTWVLLQRASIGKQLRAAAEDSELAHAYGLDRDRLCAFGFFVGSALAGVAGILLAWDTDMTPSMGFTAVLMGIVAIVIGGIGRISGVALGAAFVALAQHLTGWWISSRWQEAIVFVVLILFLLMRPQGFLGVRPRGATL